MTFAIIASSLTLILTSGLWLRGNYYRNALKTCLLVMEEREPEAACLVRAAYRLPHTREL